MGTNQGMKELTGNLTVIDHFRNKNFVCIPKFLNIDWINKFGDKVNWLVEAQLKRFNEPIEKKSVHGIPRLSKNLITLTVI